MSGSGQAQSTGDNGQQPTSSQPNMGGAAEADADPDEIHLAEPNMNLVDMESNTDTLQTPNPAQEEAQQLSQEEDVSDDALPPTPERRNSVEPSQQDIICSVEIIEPTEEEVQVDVDEYQREATKALAKRGRSRGKAKRTKEGH